MKTSFTIVAILLVAVAAAQQPALTPGKVAPNINLLCVNGKKVSLDDYPQAKGFIIVFTCNTCPYAKAYEQRIMGLDYQFRPLGFPVIAINPNDAGVSPGDSFEKMRELAKSHHYAFPYLYDKGQQVTMQYGARNTPQVFVVSRNKNQFLIAYSGAIDNDTQNTNPAKINYVEDAVNALLKNNIPAVTCTKAIGCGVRWKKSA